MVLQPGSHTVHTIYEPGLLTLRMANMAWQMWKLWQKFFPEIPLAKNSLILNHLILCHWQKYFANGILPLEIPNIISQNPKIANGNFQWKNRIIFSFHLLEFTFT